MSSGSWVQETGGGWPAAGQCQAGEGEQAGRRSAQVSWGEVGDGGVLGGFDAADGEPGGERQREHGGLQTRYRHWPFRCCSSPDTVNSKERSLTCTRSAGIQAASWVTAWPFK